MSLVLARSKLDRRKTARLARVRERGAQIRANRPISRANLQQMGPAPSWPLYQTPGSPWRQSAIYDLTAWPALYRIRSSKASGLRSSGLSIGPNSPKHILLPSLARTAPMPRSMLTLSSSNPLPDGIALGHSRNMASASTHLTAMRLRILQRSC
nr:hypothetical protein CFP56_12323 [Quercus suber]